MAARQRPAAYERRVAIREPYDTVLIVCEGSKTEPFYFEAIRRHYRISSANIEITPANGSDPMSIVAFAMARSAHYDKTYCVFDRDGDTNYAEALRTISKSPQGKSGTLKAIKSVPCFEIWLLLHYRYSDAPIVRVGSRSPGAVAEKELKTHIPGYTKGRSDIYELTQSRYHDAVRHADQLRRHNTRTGSDNPHTDVHFLTEYLCNLKA